MYQQCCTGTAVLNPFFDLAPSKKNNFLYQLHHSPVILALIWQFVFYAFRTSTFKLIQLLLNSWGRSAYSRNPKTRKARGGPKELSTDISALCPLQDLREAYLRPR